MVDDCDLFFEFRVGQNFGAQDKDPDCPRHYKLQCQRGHVVRVVANGTALADRREPSDVLRFWITTTREDWNLVIRQGPDQRRCSLRFCWRRGGLGQYNQTSWSTWNGEPRTNLSK